MVECVDYVNNFLYYKLFDVISDVVIRVISHLIRLFDSCLNPLSIVGRLFMHKKRPPPK